MGFDVKKIYIANIKVPGVSATFPVLHVVVGNTATVHLTTDEIRAFVQDVCSRADGAQLMSGGWFWPPNLPGQRPWDGLSTGSHTFGDNTGFNLAITVRAYNNVVNDVKVVLGYKSFNNKVEASALTGYASAEFSYPCIITDENNKLFMPYGAQRSPFYQLEDNIDYSSTVDGVYMVSNYLFHFSENYYERQNQWNSATKAWIYLDENITDNIDSEVDPSEPPDTDPYSDKDGTEPLPGGEDVDLPPEPSLTALDAGLFALFSPTSAQMKSLADFLWTDFGGSGATVEQVLGEVVEALKRTVSNPLNSMLGLSIIASQGLTKGSASNVHVGFWDTGVAMTKLTKQYFTVDCGSLGFNPVCGNTFLDYAPYSKFSIFLPYVGMRELDANDVVGHTLSVKYRGDCVTGALVCYLKRDGTIIAEFQGNCALNLPLSADSWGATVAAAGAVVAGGIGGAVAGSAGAAGGAIKAAASIATNPSAFSSQVSYSGSVSGGAGHIGSQKPFILREAVSFHNTSHFNSVIGYPSFHYKKLGECSGYTQVLDVHLENTPCTGDELQEIEEMLKKGVII